MHGVKYDRDIGQFGGQIKHEAIEGGTVSPYAKNMDVLSFTNGPAIYAVGK